MPTFGGFDPLYEAEQFNNYWEEWHLFYGRFAFDVTPSRVIWVANTGCNERYQILPAAIENPET
jgi:hypothetical protein